MKKFTVKTRITVWLTLLMALLSMLLLSFMLIISNTVATETAMSQLSDAMQENLSQISLRNGHLSLGTNFHFFKKNVRTLIYNKEQKLLAGRMPVSFSEEEPFQNGLTRTVFTEEDTYLVLDLCIPIKWKDRIWVRCLIKAPDTQETTHNLLIVMMFTLPVFLILSAFGSYWIARRAFRPLDSITATAKAITQSQDLSRRIGLPPGRDEFSHLAKTFDQLFERLEQAFETEKQFTADASHELRTPVSIIKGACEYAQKYDETPQEQQESIAMIYRQTLKISRIISQLLHMTRLEQGTEQSLFEYVNLNQLIDNLCAEQMYDPNRLIVEAQKAVVFANPSLLSHLIQNLIDNGFKYGKPNGHVWVSVCYTKDEVLIKIRDDGIGIAGDQQDKIWQRFYQIDPAHSSETGTGLGLSMVRQIAKVHNGYMTLESTPGIGSTFTLHLPPAAAPPHSS